MISFKSFTGRFFTSPRIKIGVLCCMLLSVGVEIPISPSWFGEFSDPGN